MDRQYRLYESSLNTTWGMEMGNPMESQFADRDIRWGFRPGLRSWMGLLKHCSRHCLSLLWQVSAACFLWPFPKIRRYLDDFWISYAVASIQEVIFMLACGGPELSAMLLLLTMSRGSVCQIWGRKSSVSFGKNPPHSRCPLGFFLLVLAFTHSLCDLTNFLFDFFHKVPSSRPIFIQNVSKFPHEGFMNVRMLIPSIHQIPIPRHIFRICT